MASLLQEAVHLFRLAERETQDSRPDLSQHYLAIELNDRSKELLKNRFNPNEKGFQVDPHHVTLKYDLDHEADQGLLAHVGRNINMRVTHHASMPGLHAVRAQPIGKLGKQLMQRAGKAHPHVTVAYDPTRAKPVQSNDLLASGPGERLKKFIHIGGTVKLIPKPT